MNALMSDSTKQTNHAKAIIKKENDFYSKTLKM